MHFLPTVVAAEGDGLTGVALVLVALGGALLVVLFVAALVSIVGSPDLSPGGKAVWVLGCLVLQLLGPLAWFLWGRRAAAGRR